MEAFKAKELVIIHSNTPGAGAAVFGAVADASVNVLGLSGFVVGKKVVLSMVTENNAKAKKALKKAKISVDERQVVCIRVANKTGIFAEVTKLLSENAIDIDFAYASVGAKTKALVILQTSDDAKVIRLLKKK